eukprot:628807-Pyramimonas_sp.AAC.1
MHRLECPLKRGREHGREVRKKTMLTRLRYELAFEQDQQLHVKKFGHESYNAEILKRVTGRLSTFQISQTTKKDMQWEDELALSRPNASGRKGRRLSDQRKQTLSKDKAKLTWATADGLY